MPNGRLEQMPAKRSRRLVVLDQVARTFEPGHRYPEREVNDVLRTFWPDYARCAATSWTRGSWTVRTASTGAPAGPSRPEARSATMFDTIRGLPVARAWSCTRSSCWSRWERSASSRSRSCRAWRRGYAPPSSPAPARSVAVPVATRSGQHLKERLNAGGVVAKQIHDHEQMGKLVIYPTIALWVLAIALLWLDRNRGSKRATTVVAVLGVVAALAAARAGRRSPGSWVDGGLEVHDRGLPVAPVEQLSRPPARPGCAAAGAATPAAPGRCAPRPPRRPGRTRARRGCSRAGSRPCRRPGRGRRG